MTNTLNGRIKTAFNIDGFPVFDFEIVLGTIHSFNFRYNIFFLKSIKNLLRWVRPVWEFYKKGSCFFSFLLKIR